MQEIKIGKTYKHFKGNLYKVVALANCSETNKELVVYESIETNKVWVRPKDMWFEIVDDKKTSRFTLID